MQCLCVYTTEFQESLCLYLFAETDLFLIAQSRDEIVVNSFIKPVALYCLASTHQKCVYKWQKMGSHETFPNTPVLYVKHSGLYYWSVSTGDMRLESDVINVEIHPGK